MGNKSRGDLKEASLHSAPYKAHSVCNEVEDQGLKQTSKKIFLTIHRGSPGSPLLSCIWFCGSFFFFPLLFFFSLFLSPTQDRVSTNPKQNKTNKQKVYTKYTDNMDTMN